MPASDGEVVKQVMAQYRADIACDLGNVIDRHLYEAALALHTALLLTDRDEMVTRVQAALVALNAAIGDVRAVAHGPAPLSPDGHHDLQA